MAEQGQPQLQPVYTSPADGGVPGRAKDLIFFGPLIEAVRGAEPGPEGPALLDQGPGPLSHAEPHAPAALIGIIQAESRSFLSLKIFF